MEEQVLSKMDVNLVTGEGEGGPADIFYDLKPLSFDSEGRVSVYLGGPSGPDSTSMRLRSAV